MGLPDTFRSADNQQAPGQEWPPLSGSQTENHRLGQPAKGAVAMTIGRLTRREAVTIRMWERRSNGAAFARLPRAKKS
jgi:hypothetical protein